MFRQENSKPLATLYPDLIDLIQTCLNSQHILTVFNALKSKMVETGIDLWSFCSDVDRIIMKKQRKQGRLDPNHRNITGICLFIRCLLSVPQSDKQSCIDMIICTGTHEKTFEYSLYLWNCFLQAYPNDWSRNLPFLVFTQDIETLSEQQQVFVALTSCTTEQLSHIKPGTSRIFAQLILLARIVIELQIWLDLPKIQSLFPMDLKLLRWNHWYSMLGEKPNIITIRVLFDQVYKNALENVSIFPNFIFALRVARKQTTSAFLEFSPNMDDPKCESYETTLASSQITSKQEELVFILTSRKNLERLQTDDNAKWIHFDGNYYHFDDCIAWIVQGDEKIHDLVDYFKNKTEYLEMQNGMTAHIVKIPKIEFAKYQEEKTKAKLKAQQQKLHDQQEEQRQRSVKKKQQKQQKKYKLRQMQENAKHKQMKSTENWKLFIHCLASYWKMLNQKKLRIKEFVTKCKNFVKNVPIHKTSLCLHRATIHGCFKVITFCLGELDSIHCFDVPEHSYELQTSYAFDFLMNLEFLVRPNIHDFIYRSDLGKNFIHCDHIALVAEYAEEKQIHTSSTLISDMIMERCRILLHSPFPSTLKKVLKKYPEFHHLSSIVDMFQLLNINIKALLRLHDENPWIFIRHLDAIYSDVIELSEKHVLPWQKSCKVKNVWRLLVNPLPQSVLLKWIYGMDAKHSLFEMTSTDNIRGTTLFEILGFEKDIGFRLK
jgi:hypothetical protein